ncbi:general transcription factor II-I repeat domain-containing protein 2-like [Centruroides vittatus]|uniref:general transcription factor II-I repeat domain-containing protein 2-like n=1 Tax=Centruroides vittatus TaxID=120091 RepID=UPI00350FB012
MSTRKKRKIEDENRIYNESWKYDYFFIHYEKNLVCLICSESIAVFKEYNVKRHYTTKHSNKYDQFTGDLKKQKVEKLMKAVTSQQAFLMKTNNQSESVTKASYEICNLLAKTLHCYSDGMFIKQCIEKAVEIICPDQKKIFANISLSRRTVARRIDEMADNVDESLKKRVKAFEYFFICLDESTDITDTVQLAIFIRGVDSELNITEDFLDLVGLKGNTTGEIMYGAFEKTLEKNELSLLKLSGITTDGAQSFRGERPGLIGILSNKLAQNENPNDLFICHCVLHVENLCAKKINMEHVMDIVVSTVNFLRGRALNHRQFKEFLSDIDAENNDVVYFTDVRWLSKSSVLQRFYNLLPEIKLFMEMKGKPVKELSDCEWLTGLAFFVDITMHLSELNIKMQGKNLIISEFITFIKAFISKLKLWSTQLRNKNCHFFPTLLQRTEPKNYFKYAEKVEELEQEFKN